MQGKKQIPVIRFDQILRFWNRILRKWIWILGLTAGITAFGTSPEIEDSLRALLNEVKDLRYAGSFEEGMALAEKVLADSRDNKNEQLVAEAIYQIALLHYFQEELDPARANLEIGYNLACQLDLKELQADFLGARGVLEWKLGNLSTAREHLQEALHIFGKLGQPVNMASTANNLGLIAYSLKDYAEAIKCYEMGLEYLEDADQERFRASLYSNLAEVLIPSGQLEKAEDYLEMAMALELKLQEPRNLAYTYFNFGELRSKQGDSALAIQLYEQALQLQLDNGDAWGSALTRLRCATEFWTSGQRQQAMAELESGFQTARELNALSLLRDFARLSAQFCAEKGESGLSRYYGELADWFDYRIQKEDTASWSGVTNASTPTLSRVEAAQDPKQTPVQTATVLILCVLIGILVIENVRLRKGAKPPGREGL